jgi:hypothetical protein
MTMKPITSLLLTLILLTGCGPATLHPPTLDSATPTETPSPTETAIPTVAATSISQTHEHLLVTRNGMNLTMLNADGSLYKSVQLPYDQYRMTRPEDDISSDGIWLVYESDLLNNDDSLNLLNLQDETSFVITKLISPRFPENIEPIIETINQYDKTLYESDCYNDIKCLRALVQEDLFYSIGATALVTR